VSEKCHRSAAQAAGRTDAKEVAEPRPNITVPALWNGEQAPIVMPFWYDALSLGVAGAVGSHSFTVEAVDGRLINTGLHLMISTRNVETVFSALTHLLEPLKAAQITRAGAAAEIDRQVRREKLEKLKAEYRWYLQRECHPDPLQVKYFVHATAELENPVSPIRLIECPFPGRLVLGLQKHPDLVFVATYEDRAFDALYNAARTARGSLDLEALAKSARQQIFDGAQLEGVYETVIQAPRVWAIIVVSPQTAGRFLLSSDPVIAAFADFCWFIDATESPYAVEPGMTKLVAGQRMISSLMARRPSGLGDHVRLGKEAREAVMSFQERIAKACLTTAESDAKFLGHLPGLVTQISALHHLTETQGFPRITKAQAEAGMASVEVTVRQRLAVVRTWRRALGLGQFERDCDFVLSKIAGLGPISARELCRCCNELRMERLLPILKHLLDVGKILKLQDARFDVPQASSSRSQVQTS
jgi:hypothetical protein